MSVAVRILFYALMCNLWLQGASNCVPSEPSQLLAPLEVQVEAGQPSETDQSNIAVIVLRNRIPSSFIKDITVQVSSGSTILFEKDLANLDAGQSWADRFNVPAKDKNLYLSVKYNWNNQDHSLARAINLSGLPKSDGMLPILIPVISSLVGAILGAWLVNYFTGRRENARAKFEWSKMLFERYEKAYRDFLRNWGNSLSGTVLETQFNVLQENSLIPSTIKDAYNSTFSTLSDTAASVTKKHEACTMLQQAVERFMKEPWYGDVKE